MAIGVSGFGSSIQNAAPASFTSRKRPPGRCQSKWIVALTSRQGALDNLLKKEDDVADHKIRVGIDIG